jgi:hypothetical protein
VPLLNRVAKHNESVSEFSLEPRYTIM